MTSSSNNSTGAMRRKASKGGSQFQQDDEHSDRLVHDEDRKPGQSSRAPCPDEQQPARTPPQTRSRAKSCSGQTTPTAKAQSGPVRRPSTDGPGPTVETPAQRRARTTGGLRRWRTESAAAAASSNNLPSANGERKASSPGVPLVSRVARFLRRLSSNKTNKSQSPLADEVSGDRNRSVLSVAAVFDENQDELMVWLGKP